MIKYLLGIKSVRVEIEIIIVERWGGVEGYILLKFRGFYV